MARAKEENAAAGAAINEEPWTPTQLDTCASNIKHGSTLLSPVADSIVVAQLQPLQPITNNPVSVPAPAPITMDAVMSAGNLAKPKRNAALKSSQNAPKQQQADGAPTATQAPCSKGQEGGLGWTAKALMLAVVMCVVAVVLTHVLPDAVPAQKAKSSSLYAAAKNKPPKSPPNAPKTPSNPPKGSATSSSSSRSEEVKYFAGVQVKAAELVEDITEFTTAASASLSSAADAASAAASASLSVVNEVMQGKKAPEPPRRRRRSLLSHLLFPYRSEKKSEV